MDVHIYFTWQVRSVTLTRAEMCVAGPGFHGVAFTRTAPILLYGHISDPSLGPAPTLLTALAPHTPLLPLTVNYKYIISRCLLRGVAAAAVGSYLDSAWESIVWLPYLHPRSLSLHTAGLDWCRIWPVIAFQNHMSQNTGSSQTSLSSLHELCGSQGTCQTGMK